VGAVRVVGVVLVRDEDLFVERAIRNVAGVCDRIHAVDHLSRDRTGEILERLARELDHLDVRRSRDAAESHELLAGYVGTPTWALGVDGDELFDPAGLERLAADLRAGTYDGAFKLKAHVLNCDELDEARGIATGWLAPPSRPVTKLFNLGALESWAGSPERLHGGTPVFRAGYAWDPALDLATTTTWETDPLRCLHLCFLRRSSLESPDEAGSRKNLTETHAFRRGALATVSRALRRPRRLSPAAAKVAEKGTTWKHEWYARGPRVEVDARPFLGVPARVDA
jgi:hypothetical protein